MDSWCENSLFFFKTVTMATASVPKCCFVVMVTKVQDMDRSPWGFILLWLHLCSVLLCWFHTVILILLCSLLHTHRHLCLHSHPHPRHISHPKIIPLSLDHYQTRTASPAPPVSACQTARRTSWTVSSRWSWPGRRPCPSGGRAPCRPGWRLSWRCPCTSAAVQRTWRAERSARPMQHLRCCSCS